MKLRLSFLFLLFYINQYSFSQELCPPSGINVFGGDQENIISWGEPVGNIGCGDYAVDQLPYSHEGNTTGAPSDIWETTYENGAVAYTLNVSQTTTFDITLCSPNTTYDCFLEIFTNDQTCENSASTGTFNDDGPTCPESPAPYAPSEILGETLQPGQYYLVVSGFGSNEGPYEIFVTESARNSNSLDYSIKTNWEQQQNKMLDHGFSNNDIEDRTSFVMSSDRYAIQNTSRDIPEECGTFATYEVYNAVDNTLLASTAGLSFTHGDLTNGSEYCYYVKTLYDEGYSEATETGCGTPNSWEPAPPTNVYAEVWDEEISLYWTSPDVPNLGVPYSESFDEGGLLDLWLVDGGDNWLYDQASGNPAPSMIFNWSPSVQNYDQSLYAPVIPLGELTSLTLSFDYELNIWDPSGAEFFSVEYKTGSDADWTVLELFDNAGESFDFTNYSYDLTGLSGSLFFRFRAYGADSFDLNWHRVDNFSVSAPGRDTRNEYDFMGYNVYVDGTLNNSEVFDSTNYTVFDLNNELEYVFGVSAVYEGAVGEANYESALINVSAQPVYVFGDVTGVVTDPNGDLLENVLVSSGNTSSTTDADGVYELFNLNVGINSVQVRSDGFYTLTEDVEIFAQADPTLQNFVMSPDMPNPVGLEANPLDEEIYLAWRSPGNGEELEFQYYEGELANAFYFNDTYEDGFAHGTKFIVGGSFDVLAASVKVLSEGDQFWPWPNDTHGPIRVLVFDDLNGVPGSLLYDEETVAENGWATVYPNIQGLEGSFYVIASHAAGWTDPEGYAIDGNVDYPDNMVSFVEGEWFYGDYLGYGGDYMTAAQVMSYGGGVTSLSSSNETPTNLDNSNAILSSSFISSTMHLTPSNENFVEVSNPTYPSVETVLSSRDDELLEYYVYEVDADGTETFVVAVTDTFATVVAYPNYIEYCYSVSAIWNTENYGVLESRQSNVACAVPYALGDADFDSDTDINDVLAVVDFILEEDFPTEDEFRNVDVNMDEEINIADVIMMVDIIYGGNARTMAFDMNEIAYVDLIQDYQNSKLGIVIEYGGPVRGIELELEFDPETVNILSTGLSKFQNDVMVNSKRIEDGKLKVVAANLNSGLIEGDQNMYLDLPIQFNGNDYQVSTVSLKDIKIVGADGNIIRSLSRTESSDVKAIPVNFALQQNFPNPFNPSTEIRFDLPENDHVTLAVYNMMGQKIKTLATGNMTPGYHSIIWNGTNDTGAKVATGMYFYSINTKNFQSIKKMLFLK